MDYKDVFIREVRVNYFQTQEKLFDIRTPEQVAEFVRGVLMDNRREHLVALYLNGSHSVASYSIVSIGTATEATAHPREVFQRAIACGASAIVLAHNHPSGEVKPSNEDILFTKRIKEVGELVGIKLLDHIVVADASFHSMKENGHL
jgi:DNA repair protein RadC